MTTRAMTRSQLAHATIDESTVDFQEPEYIGNDKSPEDVETFDQVAIAVKEDLPDGNAVSWTEYVRGGNVESPPVIPHDVKLPQGLIPYGVPSVGVSVWSVSVSSATSSFPKGDRCED